MGATGTYFPVNFVGPSAQCKCNLRNGTLMVSIPPVLKMIIWNEIEVGKNELLPRLIASGFWLKIHAIFSIC